MREDPYLKALQRTMEDSKGSKIGLALSGGLDSMVLAEGLHRLGLAFVVLHVDHGWREMESAADAAWVKAWCRERKIPFFGKKLRAGSARTEAAGREARRSFYEHVAERNGLGEIWLAHHADDLVETFLLQLLRGAGPEGLASMPERRKMGKVEWVRPLLTFRKAELKSLARNWKLSWREDASNRSEDYLRNRIRHRLLPTLQKMTGRDPSPVLARCARILSDENVYWEELLPEVWPENLACAGLKKASVALQRRAIRSWLLSRKVKDLSFEDIEAVRGLLLRDKPAKVNLSKGKYCRRRSGVLFIE